MVLPLAFLLQLAAAPQEGDTVSFILSYLALAGILTLGQTAAVPLRGKLPGKLADPITASFGAFTITAAVIGAVFGTIRPVGLAAGLVMAPLTMVFMVGTIVFLALELSLGIIMPALWAPIAGLFDSAMSLLFDTLRYIAAAASRVPGITISTMPAVYALAAAPLVIYLLLTWTNSRRRANLACLYNYSY
jgi:competence protein ComEC